jgi:hypothetical protein
MRLASWTVCIRDTGRAAPRSGRGGCDAGALAFSAGCGWGRATRGAAGLGAGCAVLEVPDLVERAEAGRDEPAGTCLGAGAVDLLAFCGAAGRGLEDDGAGRAAGGGAWPY